MDNLIEVITSIGIKIYIKPRVTFGDAEAIQEYIDSQMSYNPETNKPNPITLALLKAGNRKALELLVVKAILADGTQAIDPKQVVYDLNRDDGKLVKDKVNEVYEASKISKKNEMNSSQPQ